MSGTLISCAVFAALTVAVSYLFWKAGYFKIKREPACIHLPFYALFLAFSLYFLIAFSLPYTLSKLIALLFILDHFVLYTLLSTLVSLITVFVLYYMAYKFFFLKKIWNSGKCSTLTAALFGALTYVAAFPSIGFINQTLEVFNLAFFHSKGGEQKAVEYLKMASSHPFFAILSLLMVVVLAPLIEEFLFRGMLQTYVKRYLGTKAAILISSACFAALHFTVSQGIGNIPLLGSLFVFALYLGFIYERQQALIASITLHVVFNAVSACRIFLME